MIVSLSIGRKLLILITSADIPCFYYNYLAASSDTPTILEKATMVKSLPYFSILAFPISSTKFGSKLYCETSKLDPYKISFYRNTTGFSSLTAALSNPLQSSELQGDKTTSPGHWEYQAEKHWECWAATPAAGPLIPLNVIGHESCPPDIYLALAAELMIWSIPCIAKLKVMNSMIGLKP